MVGEYDVGGTRARTGDQGKKASEQEKTAELAGKTQGHSTLLKRREGMFSPSLAATCYGKGMVRRNDRRVCRQQEAFCLRRRSLRGQLITTVCLVESLVSGVVQPSQVPARKEADDGKL